MPVPQNTSFIVPRWLFIAVPYYPMGHGEESKTPLMSSPSPPNEGTEDFPAYYYKLGEFSVAFYSSFALLILMNGKKKFLTVTSIKDVQLKLNPSYAKEKAVLVIRLHTGTKLSYAAVNTSDNRRRLRMLIRQVKEIIEVINKS